MNENDVFVVAAYHAMASNLEVIYANNVTELPPEKLRISDHRDRPFR